MTALFRHRRSLRGKGMVSVTAYANDGRAPEEFLASEAELRRFAWAILADYAPAEAARAAAEDGIDLKAAGKARGKARYIAPHGLHSRPQVGGGGIEIGGDRHQLMQILADHGPLPLLGIGAHRHRAEGWGQVLRALIERGLAERADQGRQGVTALYGLSDEGHERLEDLNGRKAA